MKFAIVASTIAAASALTQSHNYYEEKFYNWMTQHNIEFKSGAEFAQRLAIFAANDDLIETHNAAGHSYQLGHNAYSHMTFEEFKATRLGATVPAKPVRNVNNFHGVKAADSVDWTTKGAVSGVKDQGQCGSCWAFSTVGSMEGAYAIKTGSLQTFSEQQLVDCDHNGDLGCKGGLMDNAFEWIASNNGLCSEDAYPYFSGTTTKRGTCQTTCSEVAGSDVATWTDVAQTDAALEAALTLQPVSVAIEADQAAFQLYKSGVFTATCGTNIDHGVLAVGYGTYTDGNDYWKVKNSWGTSWGMDGYILLARGISQVGGQCGILTSASYPTLANLEFTSQL